MTIKIIDELLLLFVIDPPSSEFQEGYRQALIDLRQRLVEFNQ